MFTAALLLVGVCNARATLAQSQPTTELSEQIDLARLVDLAAKRLKLNIQYDPSVLKGTVTLRLGAGVSDDELWNLTNRLLASSGLTTVQMPGEPTLSVVKLADAPSVARIEADVGSARAGFVRTTKALERRSPKEVVESLPLVLSKPGGTVAPLAGGKLVLISDLKPHVLQALALLDVLDASSAPTSLLEIPAQHLKATEIAALIERVTTTQTAVGADAHVGKVLATPDEKRLLLVCPPAEVGYWRALIDRFDQREALQTVTYSPEHFGIHEVAKLVEEVVRGSAVGGAGEGWRLVPDELTGSLLITATPNQHREIAALLDRLKSAAGTTHRPMRFFPIKNRGVTEVVEVLERLMDAGAIEGTVSRTVGGESTAKDASSPSALSTPAPATPTGPSSAPAKLDGRRVGGLSLTADKSTNTLIAIGEPRLLEQLETLLVTIDVRQPQVLIEALVVSLNDSDTLNLGVELQNLASSGNTQFSATQLFGLGSPPINGTLPVAAGTGFSGVVLHPGDFSVLLKALQTINHGRTLTMPKVLVNNNETAKLNSVLQQPFASTNASTTVATTSFGGTQDAGTIITVKPQITEGDQLLLDYSVTLSAFVGASADPTIPPPRQQNTLNSIASIPDGFTIVVGGLEITTESKSISQTPFLGDIPLIGWIFGSRVNTDSKTRFYVFLRANVMRSRTFEDLKYRSEIDLAAEGLDDGWPRVEPRLIR